MSHSTTRDIFLDLLTRCLEGKHSQSRAMHCLLHRQICYSSRCYHGVLFSVTYPTWLLWFKASAIDFYKLILHPFHNASVSSGDLFKSPCRSSYYLQIMTFLSLTFRILCLLSFSCLMILAGSLLHNGSANIVSPILMGKFLQFLHQV